MKNAKRWLAILLAVTLLCSNGIYQLGTTLSANETETTEEAQPEENSETVAGQTDGAIEDTGKATVQEVTPEEESGDSSAQDAETANVPEAAAQEDVQEGQNEATVQEPAAEAPAAEAPAAEGAGQAEEAAAPEVQTYNVKINKSELDGGQIKVWGSDNTQVDVTEYDGNNQYVKEVKEGEEFNFQITLKDGFDGAQVKVNNNDLAPESTDGNVITYKVAGINEEKVIDVTYNKVETPAEEEVKAEEPKAEDEVKAEEPEDNSVNTASLNENVSTVADTDINRTVRVGQTITLDSEDEEKTFYSYTHQWTVTDSAIVRLNATSGTSITVTGLNAGKITVKDTYKGSGPFGWSHNGEKTYTITVRSAVTPTNIAIEGLDNVTQFQTMQLTAKLTPADADGTVTWSSSNEQILSVDNNGLVTGKRQGEATVTASVQGTAVSTTKKITVEQDTATTGTEATVFFLLDPTKNPNSNDQSEWGAAYGTAVVNLKNAIWVDDKNCFEDVDQRVISWPNGTNVIPRNSDAWEQIFNNYQATLKKQFGELKFSKDDVEEITLVPAKISKNNGTTSTSLATHLDCSVNIKCKNIALVKYYLFDAGGTGYVQQGAKNYIINDSAVTDPKSVTGKDFQTIKEVGGVTYTFSGWYTDQSLTNLAPEFPAKVIGSVEYYAKYIAGYQVVYDLAGGKFSDDSTSATEKHNVEEIVTVKGEPTRAGYKFTGWKVEGVEGIDSINSGETFTMPNNSVTLTAQWEEQKINDFITLNTKDVEKVYDGEALEAGTATVNGKSEGVDITSVKIEYSLDGQTWKENPSEITAINVSDSKTVQVRATSPDYVGTLTGEQKLTINKAAVTLKSADLSKPYDGKALVNGKTALATETGWAEGEGATYSFTGSQTLVGSSANAFSYTLKSNTKEANYNISKSEGTLTVTNRPEDAKYEITVKANSAIATYDGKPHTAAGLETATFEVDGSTYTVEGLTTEDPTKTDAGTYTNNITGTAVVKDASGNDVTAQFVVKTENGSLVINKAAVTLKSADLSKPYDGKALVNGKTALATETGWAEGEGATYSFTGSQTLVGSSANAFSYTLKSNTKEANYNISKSEGTLTVTNRPEDAKYEITVKANSAIATYDGKPHTAAGLETATFEVDGSTYTVEGLTTEDPTKTDAGTYTNNITGTAVVKDASGNDVSAQFVVSTENGSLTINKADVTLKSADLSKPYDGDALVNGTTALATEEGWAESDKASVAYDFTGSQKNVGNSDNTFTVKWNETVKESNYNVTIEAGTLTVTAQSIDPENPDYKGITVNTPADVEYNGADQTWKPIVTDGKGNTLVKDTDYTVTYDKEDLTNVTGTITVTIEGAGNYAGTITRTYQITPKPVTITTESATKAFDGTALTAGGKVEGIVSGETYGFNTTGSQTFVGSSQNTYEMVWADSEVEGTSGTYTAKSTNYTVIESIGILAITAGTPENPLDPTLVVKKTHDKNQTYKAGDVITFTITAKNIYEEAKTITLEELEGVTLDASVFENVAPGAEITATATYTVTEQDIVNGTFTNNVTVTFSGVEDKFTGTDTVDEFEDANPHMTITKTTVGADEGHIYKLGEVINYQITATNDGNLTLTNVKVEDALTGNVGENAFTIDTLAPNEAQTFDVRYTVTENDVLAGKVVNNATGSATDPETPVTPGEKEDPIETPNPSLTVVKTSDKTGVVKLGETVTYTITVTNNGNVTINDIEVTDELTGNTGENAFTIDKLAVGESKQFTATYTVTEADILAGKIVNIAKASGTDPKDKDVTDEGKTEVETEKGNPQITVTKETTSKPANGKAYALGEEITYKITAKNTGNETLKDVTVIDELTGLKETIDTLAPGEEKTFDTSYTVKESDLGKTVVNVATATGTTPDVEVKEPDVKPGETEDPVEDKKPALAVDKKVVDLKEEYQIGDVVTYEITVTNTGNTTQKNILVEDQMKAAGEPRITKIEGANGINNGTQATLDKLAPGAKATITVEYTIVNDDRGNTITNAAVVKGDGTGEDNKPVTPEVPVVIEKVYNINVVHEFAPGSEGDRTLLPEDYTIENLKPNTVKSLIAETVTGYVAYPAVQNVKIVDEDITVTFQYYKDEMGTDPTNPEKPDGLPDEFQTVVRFAAVNGTVSTDHAVVTLFDKDGKPAKDGVGHLSAFQIAAAKANDGYDQSSLSWAPGEPTITYDITGGMTFTATFTATPAPTPTPTEPTTPTDPAAPTTPTTPAAPTTTPARPAARTTEPTGNAFIDNVVTPIVEKAEEKVAEIKEVFNSDDDNVPLADQKLDDNNDHKCCILHFLIMLITLLVYAFATKSMKKRQKKLHEVREELDCELAKRGLPLSTEKQ